MRPTATHSKASASIIIPAYNAAKTIADCLDALKQQTISPKEIIVVDDGSKDNTSKVVATFSNVKLTSQANAGPARARNVGAKAAKGDIIIFLDSDCVPEKNWLEEMLKPFEDAKVAGVQGAYKSKQKSIVARFDQLDIEYRYERMKRAEKLDWIGSYSAAYRRDIFLKENGFDESFPKASGEDAELSYRMAEKKYRLIFAPSAIVYHTHPEKFWKFLDIEYFRAYWRMRMYIKHPLKAVKDSYTPQTLKISVMLGAMMLAGGLLSLIGFYFEFHRIPNVLSMLVLFFAVALSSIIAINSHFIVYAFVRDFSVGVFSLFMSVFRSIVFGAGVLRGFLDEKVRA
ncbi:MAG: glycosyltransferase [Candidatus Iainarchaeum archaeon]|uniref:Glycosyltransferase n=1 Tax=Candidatus Iainarchaeum sp. TaxID=3101447 RepID=A0A7T9DIQ1_9ARCH|nr:MAG: glycosyltransferase [Candidatus Diapherotrites archaeon]